MDRPFLIGKKIYLRPMDRDDLNDQYLQWVNTEDKATNLGTLQFPSTRDALEHYLEAQINNKDVVFFAIMERNSDRRIGTCKIGPIDWINSNASVGCLIGDASQRLKGYGTETWQLLIRYAFKILNLHKIVGWVSAGNIGSIKSMEKAGFKVEARLKEYGYHDGKYEDTCILSILKNEFL